MPASCLGHFENFIHASFAAADATLDDFALPQHRCVYAHWLSHRGAADLPRAESIDPLQLREALGYIILLEPNADSSDFRYRLFGSAIREIFKRDPTGTMVSDLPLAQASVFGAQHRALLALRRPIYSEHDAPPEVSSITRWCRLILPYAGADGAITRILVADVPRPTRASR